jgi:hypothetical protein
VNGRVTATDGVPPEAGGIAASLRAAYRRFPEETRRRFRPLNLVDEWASFLPAALRSPVLAATYTARRLALLGRVRYPVRRLEGVVAGGARLTCILAMDDLSARYWRHVLFAREPAEEVLGMVAPLRVRDAAARLAPRAEISLWQLSWPAAALADAGPRVPSSVPLWLATDRPLEEVVRGEPLGRSSRREEVRRVRRLGLQARRATRPEEIADFHRRLYEPYGRRRFGDLFAAVPAHAFRQAARNGWLLLLELDGRTVAGALLERWKGDVRFLAHGVDLEGPVPAGIALPACYYHAIRFATETGLPRLSLGTCRPTLSDGVLLYKRKWGGRLGPPTTWDAYALRYRNTPGVRAALAATPLVVDVGGGRLAGLAAARDADGADPAGLLARLDTPGLCEIACLVGEARAPAATAASGVPVRTVPANAVWPPEAAA